MSRIEFPGLQPAKRKAAKEVEDDFDLNDRDLAEELDHEAI